MGSSIALSHFDGFHGLVGRTVHTPNEVTHLPQIIQRILGMSGEQSLRYIAEIAARERHWQRHPTGFACIACMDGRVHLPTITRTAMGLVKPYRAMGGRFEIWWPAFAKRFTNWADAVLRHYGERCCVFVTYHHSASNNRELGCAGWACDTVAARAHAEHLAADINEVYRDQVYAIVVGIETDRGILNLHGPRGTVTGAMQNGTSEDHVRMALRETFLGMPPRILEDIIPFVTGNAAYVTEHGPTPRPDDVLCHQELVIAVGHGFDYWISEANLAVAVDDADPNLDTPIATAAKIVANNLKRAGPKAEALLLASVPFERQGTPWNLAVKRAEGLGNFALECILASQPSLLDNGRLRVLIGVTSDQTKQLEPIAFA
ncbi:MAG: hypothetical protein Q7T01_00125 [bacterium]|nr:hypothetical protein [bacterium]